MTVATVLQNEIQRRAIERVSLTDRIRRYFTENQEIIALGLAGLNGQNVIQLLKIFHN